MAVPVALPSSSRGVDASMQRQTGVRERHHNWVFARSGDNVSPDRAVASPVLSLGSSGRCRRGLEVRVSVTKVIVCLANSYKHGGRCVAGIEIEPARPFALPQNRVTWIRPVSHRPGHEVNERERQYPGGEEPQVLDVVSVVLGKHQPNGFQQENWLLDAASRWRKLGRIGWDELRLLEQRPSSLWINGYHSYSGTNDRVPVEHEHKVKSSLKIIHVDEVNIDVESPSPYSKDGRPSVRARFRFAGADYSLKVTDPVQREKFRAKGLGTYRSGKCFLTVSIAEKFDDGYIYKVVAGMVDCGDRKGIGRR